jgi:DNA primase small subunit
MPHSVSPEDTTTPDQEILIADAETNNGEIKTTEHTLTADVTVTNGDSQFSETMDQDMTMVDAGVEGETVPEVAAKEEKPDVKLEDLFADFESDEEFPSSDAQDTKLSSSPEPPSSRV